MKEAGRTVQRQEGNPGGSEASIQKRAVAVSTLLQGHVGRGDEASGMAMRIRWSPACTSISDTLLPDALCPRPYPG